jgi:hypothetical protein
MSDLRDSILRHGGHPGQGGSDDPELGGRRGSGGAATTIAVVLVLAGAAWLGIRKWSSRQEVLPTVGSRGSAAATASAATTRPAAPLPPLDASDALVRQMLATVSAHPQLASWLVTDDLVRRFVATVINLAEGASPASHVRFLQPAGAFRAGASGTESNTDWFVDPSSFHRYDVVTEVLLSLDPARAAELHRRLHPLLDSAYAELGNPASSFDATLAAAIDRLLAVPVPPQPVAVVPGDGQFVYADPALEERSAAERHLLRLGPDNQQRDQLKLRELRRALALPPA